MKRDRGATDDDLPAHVLENRRHWDAMAHDWVAMGERAWARGEPTWGIWGVPESDLRMLPADMTGLDAVELGCGTGYVSAWMARRGARVTGIDNSAEQLATARRLAAEHGLDLTLVHGNAERTPFADGAFDFAISEYGAAIWCDPHVWIVEAHRILRPGGRLVFLGHHPWAQVCASEDGATTIDRMVRPYFDLGRLDWTGAEVDPGGIEFNLTVSAWFALFRRVGFSVEDYREPRPAPDADDDRFSIPSGWARDFPSEQVWKLRKVG
jgi:SAM-dependent methyltransferase